MKNLLSVFLLVILFATPLSAEILCVKNKQKVSRTNSVVLKKALRMVTGSCPRGFKKVGAMPGGDFVSIDGDIELTDEDEVYATVELDVPEAGMIMVNASGCFISINDAFGLCSISLTDQVDTKSRAFMSLRSPIAHESFGLTRGFNVEAGINTFNLVCRSFGDSPSLVDVHMTAMFAPVRY